MAGSLPISVPIDSLLRAAEPPCPPRHRPWEVCHPPAPSPAPWPCQQPERLAFSERMALLEAVQEIRRLEAENAYAHQALARAEADSRSWYESAMDARAQLSAARREPAVNAGSCEGGRVDGVQSASAAPAAGVRTASAEPPAREVAVPYPVTVRSLIDLFA